MVIEDTVTIEVDAVDDGIRGKDYLIVEGDTYLVITAGTGDGLKSDNNETGTGYITINGGTFNINAGNHAISAELDLTIAGGDFIIEASGKGLKASDSIIIKTGSFEITSTDDGIHSSNYLEIIDGTFTISSGDDAIHADTQIIIEGGDILISECYEGIESQTINITGDSTSISVTSSDDGINCASDTEDNFLYITGGYVYVNALGDGIDSNGGIYMTSGSLIVSGPTSNDNAAVDYDTTYTMNGGLLIAAGWFPIFTILTLVYRQLCHGKYC